MPETGETVTMTTSDENPDTTVIEITEPGDIKASDILKDLATTQEAEDEPAETDEDDTDTDDESEEDTDELADEPSEDSDDEDEDSERFALDPEVAKALPEKERKRLEEQIKGLRKRDTQIRESEERLTVLDSYMSAFSDPVQAGKAVKQLTDAVLAQHGLTTAEVFGFDQGEGVPDWQRAGYDSPGEFKLAQKLDAIERERNDEKLARAQRAHFDEVAPKIIKRIANRDSGWTVNREMIETAIASLPQFKDKPEKAVQMYYSDERAKHYAGLSTKKAPKGPEAFPANGRTPMTMPTDPSKITASHILANL
jgi:hypothetical protein